MDILQLTELPPNAFSFEMHSEDNFGIVLQKYMEEQKLSVTGLARKSGLSFKAIPNNQRLSPLPHICLHIFRHLVQKFLDIRQYTCEISIQSDKKFDGASVRQ